MTHEEESQRVFVSLKGGTDIVKSRLVFSNDSKWAIGCSGSEVKVWSVVSGKCAQRLQGHKAKVTAVALNPQNFYQLYSCGLDQTIIKWDFVDGVKLQVYHIAHPLAAIYPLDTELCIAIASTTLNTGDDTRGDVIKFKLSKQTEKTIKPKKIVTKILCRDNMVALGCKGRFVAAITKSKLHVHSLKKDDNSTHIFKIRSMEKQIALSKEFCCVAAHPVELCVATGMQDGKIIIWWNVMSKTKAVTSIHHWHSLPVQDVAFTAEGSYLLSGGLECVLVKWHHNTTHRDFLPRLGSPITRIVTSRDNTLYGLCHADNGIQIVSSNFEVIQIIQGMTRIQSQGHIGLTLDPRSGCVVSNGRLGHLQFYHLQSDTQLYNLDIVHQNYISPENLSRPLIYTEVTKAAFSHNGSWLATVDERIDGKTTPEICLKFWMFDQKTQGYTLNTSVDLPHDMHVECLKFRPPSPGSSFQQAITTSKDCKFKLWVLEDDTNIYRKRECWHCDSVGFYRELPASAADYSEDGSLLGVTFTSKVTLWDPDTNALCDTLTHPDPVTHMAFCRGVSSHLLMCATARHLYTWNLLTCTLLWAEPIQCVLIQPNPVTDVVAVFTNDSTLHVYRAGNKHPVYTHRHVCPRPITSALFLPCRDPHPDIPSLAWQGSAKLYFTNDKQELFTLEADQPETNAQKNITLKQSVPANPLSELLLGKASVHQRVNTEGGQEQMMGQPGAQFLTQLLSTPAHVLPPVHSLCMPFMNSLLLHKKQHGILSSQTEKEDDSSDVSDEDLEADESGSDMDITEATPSKQAQRTPEKSSDSTEQQDYSSQYNKLKPELFNWMT